MSSALDRACARIAPTWPLDRFIAVNPFWGHVDAKLPDVAAKLRSLSGARLLMPRSFYRDAYERGVLRDEHLRAAIGDRENESVASLVNLLGRAEPALSSRRRMVDVADEGRDLRHMPSWRSFVTSSVSQVCAAYFDDGQATFGPDRTGGLYATWLRHALLDRSPTLLMGASSYRTLVRELPAHSRDLIGIAIDALGVGPDEEEDYLLGLLLDQNGWASWCAYLRWTARLEGRDDDAIVDLLAIRLAWEWILLRDGGPPIATRWADAIATSAALEPAAAAACARDWLLQEALEIAWREPVVRALEAGFRNLRSVDVAVQAVFCIDVRSEVFRRALEATSPRVQTLGFAGFFGLPIEVQPLGATSARPQLPGLLAPALRVADTGVSNEVASKRANALDVAAAWRSLKSDAMSTFTFVEAVGLTYAIDLVKASVGAGRVPSVDRVGLGDVADARRKPRIVATATGEPVDVDARTDLALGILRGMSLTRDLARVVLLVGHGSTTRNNPHAAGLDCGACCGQTGEVNARVAASLLNEPGVRAGLAARGVSIPESTWFVAALHDTTSDVVELFDLDEMPASHRGDIDALRAWLTEAGAKARRARAKRLGLTETDPAALDRAVLARTSDWAQVRAEWGLANNAAFIVAPREHVRDLDLEGRSFLHEYRHAEDDGYKVLELIMTAPMVVTHWINFQYYASTVDNARYGSGDKVLHNVVGGHVGVFEGNGGDLRIGLPMQSLHDGTSWVHTPLRLSVFIEAPRAAIDAIVNKHAKVRDLVTNGWVSLFQLDEAEGAVYGLRDGEWQRCDSNLRAARTRDACARREGPRRAIADGGE